MICSIVGAQSFYKVVGTTGNDYAEQVINDRDSGFVVIGGTEGLGQGEMDGYMIKLDTAGNIQWTRTFGDAGVDWLTAVVLLDDGMISCGFSNTEGDYQIYVVRTNEIGQVVWEREFGNENWEFPEAMTLVDDTTLVIVGEVYEDGETTTNGLLCSISINGDSLWYSTAGDVYDDVLERVILSDSGQIYVCGSYEVEENNSDYWVGRIDQQGIFEWELFLGDTLNDYAHGITELITGEFIVTGGDDRAAGTNIDNVFYKIDSSGNVIFQNMLNNPDDDIGIDVLSYPDTNKFILVNSSSSVGYGLFDTWLFDCNYYTFGVEDFSFVFGTYNDDIVVDADTTFDKGVICVGNIQNDTLGNAIFIHKTNSEENAINYYETEEDLAIDDQAEKRIRIYPNPVSNEIFFSEIQTGDYVIYDLNGRLVKYGQVKNGSIRVNLSSGMYLLKFGGVVQKFCVVQP